MRQIFILIAPACFLIIGCLQSGRSLTSWFIDPEIKGQHEPPVAVAARVDQVGRQLLAANPFSGIDATFQVLGHPDALIFHRDRVGVFISDALVDQCKTDAELAAVLASELGKMVAEQRNLSRMGYVDQFSQVPTANPMDSTNLAADPVRMTELAKFDQRQPRKTQDDAKKELTDPKKIAAEMLRTAGLDEKALAAVDPILKNANKNRDVLKQLGAGGSEPVWSR
jgi:hypothetical protein